MGAMRLPRLVVSAAIVAVTAIGPGHAQTPVRPNVLIVITDDQRRDGTIEVMSRTSDWFGRGGTRFTSAVATTPTCCPSRASIFTGRYAHNHGVRTSEPGQAELLDQDTTLQRYLHDGGYATALFGKYLNGWDVSVDPPHFDRWAILTDGKYEAYRHGDWNVDGAHQVVPHYSTTFIRRRARVFLAQAEAEDERPWLMYVTPYAPHLPATPHRDHATAQVPPFRDNPAMLEEDRSDKPAYVQQSDVPRWRVRDIRRSQLRTLMAVDEMVAGIVERLRELGEADDTLAFFISDNGYLWGEHGLIGKRAPYLASVDIPFYVRWPGRFIPGISDDRLVANVDVMPTVMEAAGLTPEHVVDGRSLLSSARDHIVTEHWLRAARETPDWAALRTPSYHYIEYYVRDRLVVNFAEYYDLTRDPWELDNLLADGDSSNDPQVLDASLRLQRAIRCDGTTGTNPCP